MNKNKVKNIMMIMSLLTGFFFTVLLIMLIFDFNTTKFKLSKLEKYIVSENNYISVTKYYNTDIKTNDDTISISFSNDENRGTLRGTLSGEVLTFKIPNDDKNILLKGKLIASVADSIGQLNGNKKGYVSTVLGSIDYSKINLKENGLEVYKDGENNVYKFRVDKRFVLGSVADVYFKEDLSTAKKSNAIHNFSLLRKICFNLINLDDSVKRKEVNKRMMYYNHNLDNLKRLIFEIYPNTNQI